jgi:hypothetical protein
MQYIFTFIQITLGLWLAFNLYQFVVSFYKWRNNPNPDYTFLIFLQERIGALGQTFVKTFVYTILAIGAGYLIHEFIAMLME